MENSDFISRFVEVCGTAQPSIVAQMLGISYQAAKNYLRGKMPDTSVLLVISKKTTYSLHWLLTGEGDKFIKIPQNRRKAILTDEMRAFIRQECLEIINEMLGDYEDIQPPRIIALNSDDIKQEKVKENKFAPDSAE